jgi:hypothetical protein
LVIAVVLLQYFRDARAKSALIERLPKDFRMNQIAWQL